MKKSLTLVLILLFSIAVITSCAKQQAVKPQDTTTEDKGGEAEEQPTETETAFTEAGSLSEDLDDDELSDVEAGLENFNY